MVESEGGKKKGEENKEGRGKAYTVLVTKETKGNKWKPQEFSWWL